MKIEKWLVINKPRTQWTNDAKVELKSRKPNIRQNQIAIKFSINVPYSAFDTNKFEANITIPQEAVNKLILETNAKLVSI